MGIPTLARWGRVLCGAGAAAYDRNERSRVRCKARHYLGGPLHDPSGASTTSGPLSTRVARDITSAAEFGRASARAFWVDDFLIVVRSTGLSMVGHGKGPPCRRRAKLAQRIDRLQAFADNYVYCSRRPIGRMVG